MKDKTRLELEHVPVGSLEPYAANAKTHSSEQVQSLAESIRRFGFCNPVLLDAGNGIVAGHGRILAAKEAGLTVVPVIRLGHLTEAEARAYRIADNRLGEVGVEWDAGLLLAELDRIRLDGIESEVVGWTADALAGLAGDPPGEAEDDGGGQVDRAEELRVEWKTKPGQLWLLGRHRLLCGDATSEADVSRLLAGNQPHLMVTDPPYGVTYDPAWRGKVDIGRDGKLATGRVANDDRADWTPAWKLFPGDVAYVWHAALHTSTVEASLAVAGFAIRSTIVWAKQHLVLSRGDYHWKHEPCLYAVRKGRTGHWSGDRTQTTVWEIANHNPFGQSEEGGNTTGHGTQKPIECMARPIRNNSIKGDGVYDPFVGSGTTILASEQLGRSCYAMEIDPKYVAVILQRWVDAGGDKPRLSK